jgi:hypothetical protein
MEKVHAFFTSVQRNVTGQPQELAALCPKFPPQCPLDRILLGPQKLWRREIYIPCKYRV